MSQQSIYSKTLSLMMVVVLLFTFVPQRVQASAVFEAVADVVEAVVESPILQIVAAVAIGTLVPGAEALFLAEDGGLSLLGTEFLPSAIDEIAISTLWGAGPVVDSITAAFVVNQVAGDIVLCVAGIICGSGGDSTGSINIGNTTSNGSIGSCPSGYKICGVGSSAGCIPSDASCCDNVGISGSYCPAGNYCASDGSGAATCKSASSCTIGSNGLCTDQQCSDSYNKGIECVSSPNSCGMVSRAKYSCDGSCDVGPTPADDQCSVPDISFSTLDPSGKLVGGSKQMVHNGSNCTVSWEARNATSCQLKDTDGNVVASGVKGDKVSLPPLNGKSKTFTLSCMNGNVKSASQTFLCQMAPEYENK